MMINDDRPPTTASVPTVVGTGPTLLLYCSRPTCNNNVGPIPYLGRSNDDIDQFDKQNSPRNIIEVNNFTMYNLTADCSVIEL